jgi:hypothetical protein
VRTRLTAGAVLLVLQGLVGFPAARAAELPSDDPVLRWNAIAIEADRQDHSGFGPSSQGGPTRSSRALAIVHAAIYDAVNSIERTHEPYLTFAPPAGRHWTSVEVAVAQAAHDTLAALYPAQRAVFAAALAEDLAAEARPQARVQGVLLGKLVARRLLEARANDGSQTDPPYEPGDQPGDHRQDPLHPEQGFVTPGWGSLTPFALTRGDQFRALPPPALESAEYAAAFEQVKQLGGDGVVTPTARRAEQTEIGLFWAYDGVPGLGAPPRLYNQMARVIAEQHGNTVAENARLFALVNLAMADAGIACWESKYFYNFWRPILGIREADPGTGPSGLGDGNPLTEGDPGWTYLGAPASNASGTNFTPAFPAYPSGHATFGAALFRIVARFYGTDAISFSCTSDELNGVTTDWERHVRPLAPRSFDSLSAAALENAQSRIYLGIHWPFDATAGIAMGEAVADWVFDHFLRPLRR